MRSHYSALWRTEVFIDRFVRKPGRDLPGFRRFEILLFLSGFDWNPRSDQYGDIA